MQQHETLLPTLRAASQPVDQAAAARVVTCWIGPQCYGLPIAAVREVVRLPALLTISGAPPFVCGMLNLRGTYVPVLNGHMLVDEPPAYRLNSQIILGEWGTGQFGLLVDQVADVADLHTCQWTPFAASESAALLQGAFSTPTGPVVLFDMAALAALVPQVAPQ